VYICSFTAVMLQQVLQGKWRSRGSSIDIGVLAESAEADVVTAFFDLHFPIVLAAQREPRPSSTMHLSGFRSPHCMFLYSLLGSALNLWESIYQHHSQFPSTSCQLYPGLDTIPRLFRHLTSFNMAYLTTMSEYLLMSNPRTSPTTPNPNSTKFEKKKKKIGGALRCEGFR
jgi:hypothetical protein